MRWARRERDLFVRTQKEYDQVKGTHLWRLQRKGHVETWEQCELARWGLQTVRTGKRYDRLKGTHLRRLQREDMSAHGKKWPHEGPSQAGDSRVRECMLNALEIL